ncbi:prepro-urotensin II-beta [Osmerus mordax]|uniref:prepro-urotensin II-beta n=1 Tax=Osmerus mordax TaxID=8014 RepID=UPI00350F6277
MVMLVAAGPLFSHPLSRSSETSYNGQASVGEEQVVSPGELALSEQAYTSHNAAGFGFPSLTERNRLRSVLDQNQAAREALLDMPLRTPLARFLGGRTDYRKRTTTECFWKYCV